ncbi:MAG: tRNA pseudouridine(55) synthase TruB [Vicinamibacterales bacterium]
MDGLLIVDKPSGPTSHDVVARARRILRERRIGHTGTLDPLASGVLPLVVGRATRLARFLDGDKRYEAVVRLGSSTDTYDVQGERVGEVFDGPWPDRSAIDTALEPFRGTFLQRPPAFSAKKIDGERSYDIARRGRARTEGEAVPAGPAPVEVTTRSVDVLDVDGPIVRLDIHCEAGFYVRSLAHDLGAHLGMGAHLVELRRTEACGLGLDRSVSLDTLERLAPEDAAARLVSIDQMLPRRLPVVLTETGVTHTRQGRALGAADTVSGFAEAVRALREGHTDAVRLLDEAGHLLAMAGPAKVPGLLHASVVLM